MKVCRTVGGRDEEDEVNLSSEMIQDYPVQGWGSGLLMNDEFFAYFEEHLDPDFFSVTPLEFE